jgi:multiple sugar transport system substrate-binding protein
MRHFYGAVLAASLVGAGGFGAMIVGSGSARAATQITMWSNWPDEPAKKQWVQDRVADFEKSNPDCSVKLSFIPKADEYTQAKSAVRTGQAPDVFYMEPDEPEFMTGGYLAPLDDVVDLSQLNDWAKTAWTYKGHVYAVPPEAYTVEVYYNKDLLKKVGTTLPESAQLTQDEFTAMVKAAAAQNITAVVDGVGDRPFPGAFLPYEALLHTLGTDDYGKLLDGTLSYKDPRVIATLTWFKGIVDAGAYPKSISTLKLGESHTYFYQTPGGVTFPDASWYTGRAFAAPDKGGQPAGFPLGIMQAPAMTKGACPECKTLSVGGSFVMYSRSKNKACAGALLKSMATVENGTKWVEQVSLQSGIKSDTSKIQSSHAAYFQELNERDAHAKFFLGTPLLHLRGKCAETFTQVMNAALPAGLISVDDATTKMDEACKK